ncbi:hypothetical protein LJR013_003212 [Pseudarthrobacter oxydans]|uniref:hypothetical protein n=1 Tax=Pseudarthrobacter oxydans TaxID=1671 RepID=UPI003ED0896A
MNIAETSMVLAKIQAYDNRNVDDSSVVAWQEVLEPHTVKDALKAVSDYFRVNSAWIMPSHIVERVRDMEEARVYEFKNGYHLNRADEERGDWSGQMKTLGRAVRTGALTAAAYDEYQDSEKPLDAFIERKELDQ